MGKHAKQKQLIPSSSFKSCQDCDKPFNLFRLRYRCSKCLFCYCKDHLKEIRRENNTNLKLCDICLENYNRYQVIHKELHHEYSESDSGLDENSEISSNIDTVRRFSEQDYEIHNKIKNFLSEIQGEQFNFFHSNIVSFIRNKSEKLCKNQDLEEIWIDLLTEIAEEASKTVCNSVAYNEDDMNINRYIKIIKVNQKELCCKFYKAAILEKKFAYKRIPNEIVNCKILLIKGITWFFLDHKKILSMNDVIHLEKQYIINLFNSISVLMPSIVILEKTMPQQLVKELESIKIGVIMNVPIKRMQHIARICQGKIVSSLVMSDELKESLGICKKYSQIICGQNTFSVFYDERNSIYAGSVFLSHPDPEKIVKISKILKILILLYRNALIERNFLWQSNISSKENIFQDLDNSFMKLKFLSVHQERICQFPRDLAIKFYSEDDMPLGQHLISAYLAFKCTCDVCSKYDIGEHVFYYVNGLGRVKFWLEVEPDKKCYDIMMRTECRICKKITGPPIYINQSAWEYSFHKFIANFFTKSEISHSNFECSHDALKTSSYIFISQGLKASLEWEEQQKYLLLPIKAEYSEETLKNIIKNKHSIMTESVSTLLEKLASNYQSLSNLFLSNKIDMSGEFLWLQICNVKEKISALTIEISKLELSPFETLFSLETYRKYFFSNCCLIKLKLEALKSSIFKFIQNEPILNKAIDKQTLCLSLIEEHIIDEEGIFYSKEYISLVAGHMNLFNELQQKCLPAYESDSSSIITYCLGSFEYYEEVINLLKNSENIEENLESEMFNGDDFKFKFKDSIYDYAIYDSHNFKQDIHKIFGTYFEFSIVSHYAKHFHCLISAICGEFQFFLQSISKSQRNIANKKIRISHDGRYIIKFVSETTFKSFLDIALNYFRHESKVIFHNMPSRLLRILGAYQLSIKSNGKLRTEWIFLQENLGSGLPHHVQTYKLACKTQQEQQIDNRFAKDFQGIPIFLSTEHKRILDAGLWNDSLFFSKQNIINYDLLVKVNFEENTISAGICSYLDKFTFEKAIETKYKQALGNEAINPISYKENFRTQIMQGYFMAIDD